MRTARVTLTLISINVLLFFITIPLTSSQRREIARIEREIQRVDSQMVKIEGEYRSFAEVMKGTSGHLGTKEAKREFKRIFRKRIKEGEVIPMGLPEYEVWFTLYAHLEKLEEELRLKGEGFLFNRFGFIPRYPDPLSILTSFFLYVSLFSFFFNMLFLFISGSFLEERWGGYFITLIYLGGGIFGSIIHWIFTPISDLPIIGGGSAVAALMGVFAVACFREKVRFFFWLSSGFVTISWLIQLVFQPIFEPLEAVTGQGIAVPLVTAVLGVIVGLERTGRFTKKVKEGRSEHYRKVKHGYELFGLARYDEARKIFEKVITLDPENLEAYEGLARIYTHKNQEKESILAYNRVIEIAINKSYKSYNVLEKYDTFKKLYPRGILEPENQYRLGNILEENGRFDEAILVLREFCLEYPKNELVPKALFNIGKIYLRLGRGEEAVGSFEEILKGYLEVDWIDLVKEEIEKTKILIGH